MRIYYHKLSRWFMCFIGIVVCTLFLLGVFLKSDFTFVLCFGILFIIYGLYHHGSVCLVGDEYILVRKKQIADRDVCIDLLRALISSGIREAIGVLGDLQQNGDSGYVVGRVQYLCEECGLDVDVRL